MGSFPQPPRGSFLVNSTVWCLPTASFLQNLRDWSPSVLLGWHLGKILGHHWAMATHQFLEFDLGGRQGPLPDLLLSQMFHLDRKEVEAAPYICHACSLESSFLFHRLAPVLVSNSASSPLSVQISARIPSFHWTQTHAHSSFLHSSSWSCF